MNICTRANPRSVETTFEPNPGPQRKIVRVFNLSLHPCFPNTPIDQSHEDTRTNHTGSRREESMRCRTIVHWSFLALAEIVATYRFPIVPVHQQLENFPRNPSDKSHVPYASPIHPPPSSFSFHFSSLPPFISSFTVSFRPSATEIRQGKGETFEKRSNRLSHASTDQGWPSRPLLGRLSFGIYICFHRQTDASHETWRNEGGRSQDPLDAPRRKPPLRGVKRSNWRNPNAPLCSVARDKSEGGGG